MKKRLTVGISGASGIIYGIRMLEVLKNTDIETHLVISAAAEMTCNLETDKTLDYVINLANYVYNIKNIGAAIASGSFETLGMVVSPCSIKTLSGIANSYNNNLLVRAADVTLKEKRKLLLMVRETPFHKGHLNLMSRVTDVGAIVMPPVPAFYKKPKTLNDIINHCVGRMLDHFSIKTDIFKRWSTEDGEIVNELIN